METIGRYQLRAELGRGGMGVVYRAYDPELDREVALKCVVLDGVTAEQRQMNEQYLAREARAAARLQHPHAVAVHDFFSSSDRAFIVMEFVRGANLEALLATGTVGDYGRTLQILREAASALDAAHQAGIVHRDIKPGNILLDEAGRVKLADFGIARLTTAGVTQTSPSLGATAGTLSYMSPEQVRGDKLDGRSDQFALAVVAYQLLTGQLPFQGETWIAQSFKILNEPHIPARVINPGLPTTVDEAFARALAKQPHERFPDCSSFVQALVAGAPAAPGAGPSKTKLVLIPLLAIAALLIVGMAWKTMHSIETDTGDAKTDAPAEAALAEPTPPAGATAPTTTAVTAPGAITSTNDAAESLSLVVDGVPIDFAVIQPGRFVMGCNYCDDAEKPEHMVELTKRFQLGRTEVTEKQWNAVMTGKASGTNKPKVEVSWNDTQRFLKKLNDRNDGFRYRLPTEAEWEYTARANDPGEMAKNIADVAWTQDTAQGNLQDVATARMSNIWGLYDMLGNASEWTSDWVDIEYYAKSPAQDPTGPTTGKARTMRGGNANTGMMIARYAYRMADDPNAKGPFLGFRIARERAPQAAKE